MNLWKGIELNDIPEEQRDFAELVGLETFRKLVEMYGGSSIYICKEEAILRKRRNEEIVKKSAAVLKDFSVEYDCRVISAHRSLNLILDYVESMEQNKIDIIIAFAGKAAHLAGVLAGLSIKPVIGVPVQSSCLDGMDALLSTVQMPKGVPVATVAINGAENAAILAVEMLALSNPDLKEKLRQYKEKMKQSVQEMNERISL